MKILALAVLLLAWPLAGCDGLQPVNLGATRAFIDEVGDHESLVFALSPLATEGFVKQLATVQVPVAEADFVTVELEYERPFTGKVFLAWSDGAGKRLSETDNYRLRVWPYEASAAVKTVRDRYADVAVPVGAATMALSVNFLNADGNLKALRVYAKKQRRRTVPEGEGQSWARLASHDDPGAVVAMGLAFSVPDVGRAWVIGAGHEPVALSQQSRHVGALLPQQLLYEDASGIVRGLRFRGNEGFKARRDPDSGTLYVEAFAYHFGEHTYRANRLKVDEAGVRVNPNLALFRGSLPPAKEIQILRSRAERQFLFPTWQPNAHLAMVGISDHADYTSTETTRLVMYGNADEQLRPNEGLLGNGIFVTQSVFALGSVTQFTADVPHPKLHLTTIRASTIDVDPRFAPLLRKMYQTGLVEVAPHSSACCGHKDFNMVREAFYRLAEFKPVTWVDHGGRETLTMYGWDAQTAEYNIAPLLMFNHFRYVWGDTDKYPDELDMMRNDGPSSLFFRVPELGRLNENAGDLIFYASNQVTWDDGLFSEEALARLVERRGISIIHSYLGRDAVTYGDTDASGLPQLSLAPFANPAFRRLRKYIQDGTIWSATVGTWGDYVERVQAVTMESSGGVATLSNPQDRTIEGFTLAQVPVPGGASLDDLLVDGVRVELARERDGIRYHAFDLTPGTHTVTFTEAAQ